MAHVCKHGEVDCGRLYDCGKCKRELYELIWRRMTQEQRAYDRMVDPLGAYTAGISAPGGDAFMHAPEGCSCHINPPCSYCTSKGEEDGADPDWCDCCEQALDPDALEAGEDTCTRCQAYAERERERDDD